jgi:hypothetical protein
MKVIIGWLQKLGVALLIILGLVGVSKYSHHLGVQHFREKVCGDVSDVTATLSDPEFGFALGRMNVDEGHRLLNIDSQEYPESTYLPSAEEDDLIALDVTLEHPGLVAINAEAYPDRYSQDDVTNEYAQAQIKFPAEGNRFTQKWCG